MNRSEYNANRSLSAGRVTPPTNTATPRCNSAPVVVQFRNSAKGN